jgi:hypothetical protein
VKSFLTVVLLVLATVAMPAFGQVTLRFAPADTTIAPGTTGRLSIMLDEALPVRTIEAWVMFDTTIVHSVTGTGGALYVESGFQLFQDFQETTPGEWYGGTAIIGAGDLIMGPGELFVWEFEANNEGTTPVTDVATYLSAGDGTWYTDVSITSTTVTVGDPLSAVPGHPGPPEEIRLWPNPFNPRAEIAFELPAAGPIELAVFDVRGRRVTVLHDGDASAGIFNCSWNGRDADGLAQPGGVYLFRLTTPAGRSVARGVLLK